MIQEREISLNAVIRVIWERGKRILTFTIIAMIIGMIASLLIHNRYQSFAKLMVRVPSIGEHNVSKTWHPYNVYWNLFPDPKSLNDIIDKYNLDEDPYNFKSYRDLQGRLYIGSVQESPIFTITVQLESATAAADVANELAREAILISEKLQMDEAKRSSERIEGQLQTINDEMNSYRERYLEVLINNDTQLKINYLDTLNTIIATKRQQLSTIEPGIIEMQEKIAAYEKVFSSTDFNPTIALMKTIDQEPLLMEYLRDDSSNSISKIENLNLSDEEINSAYIELLKTYKDMTVQLPAQMKLRDTLKQDVEELEKQINELSDEISINQVEEQIVKQDFDRAIEVFGGIEKQAGWVGTTVNAESLDVYQVSQAVPDHKKVYPKRSLMVGLIGMIAFLVAFVYYLLLDIYGLVKTGIKKEDTPSSES